MEVFFKGSGPRQNRRHETGQSRTGDSRQDQVGKQLSPRRTRASFPIKPFLVPLLLVVLLLGFFSQTLAASLEKDLADSLAAVQQVAAEALAELDLGNDISGHVARLIDLGETIRTDNLFLADRHATRNAKTARLGPKAQSRQAEVSAKYGELIKELLALLETLQTGQTGGERATLDAIRILLEKTLLRKSLPIHGSLPYSHLGYPPKVPVNSPTVTPAYKGGDGTVTPADTAETKEAQISRPIAELAQELGWNPVLIYEWVTNNVENEWYWGLMKGAEETLRQHSGNDADQAALLVSLLRASGYPARYVQGPIEFFPGIETAKALTGLDDPIAIARFFQRAGIPAEPVISRGTITNVRVEHIWVETEVPYSNYRGAVIDTFGKTWTALDTSIKAAGFTRNVPEDMPAGFSFESVRQDYLATSTTGSPLEYLRSLLETELAESSPGSTYDDLLFSRRRNPQPIDILPGSLQFTEVAVTGEYTALPESLFHTVTFTASGPEKSVVFETTADIMDVSSRQIVLTWEPETVEDHEIMNGFGGLGNTPPYLVRLRPALEIDGERIVVGNEGFPIGERISLLASFSSPNGTVQEEAAHTVGNVAVIGIAAGNVVFPEDIPADDKDAARILYELALPYIADWNGAEDELASLLKTALIRPVPAMITLGGVMDVTWLSGIPQAVEWKGVFLDAGLRRVEVVSELGLEPREKEFMQFSALEGSALEHRIFEETLQVGAISADRLIRLTQNPETGTGRILLTIDQSNIDSLLSGLPFPANIKGDIANAVNQGLVVTIPDGEISYEDWTGIGYVKENPETGEAGYMLAGTIAGGMTAWSMDRWPDYYRDRFEDPQDEGEPNEDPAAANSIDKLGSTDLQSAYVGEAFDEPLKVLVRDEAMNPVVGVNVTFGVKTPGGLLFAGTDQAGNELWDRVVEATTDRKGIASVRLKSGLYTSDNPGFLWDLGAEKPWGEQALENIVEAFITDSVNTENVKLLEMPFTEYGIPKPPYYLKKTKGDGYPGPIEMRSNPIGVVVEDEYGNPKANIPLRFKALDPEAGTDSADCGPNVGSRPPYLLASTAVCGDLLPLWGECGNTSDRELTVFTSHKGAWVAPVLGNMGDGRYPFEVTCVGVGEKACTAKDVSPESPAVTFRHYAYPCRSFPQLYLRVTYQSDNVGRLVTAAQVGSGAVPLKAKLAAVNDGTATTNFESAQVTFDGEPGTSQGNGIFTFDYRPPSVGEHLVHVNGTASISGSQQSDGPFSMPVWGIDIQTQQPLPVILDQNFRAADDSFIQYVISPETYRASDAYIEIAKNDSPIAYLITEPQGQGFGGLSRGFQFETDSTYTAQLVLNFGNYAIRNPAGKIPLLYAQNMLFVDETPRYIGNVLDTVNQDTCCSGSTTLAFLLTKDAYVNVAVVTPETKTVIFEALSNQLMTASTEWHTVDISGVDLGYRPGEFEFLVTAVDAADPNHIESGGGFLVSDLISLASLPVGHTIVKGVDIFDGHITVGTEDFSIPARGPDVRFSRTYSNRASIKPGPLGVGWSHNYDARIIEDACGRVFVVAGDGGAARFTSDGAGGFQTQPGYHGTLRKDAEGYDFYPKDGTRYHFEKLLEDTAVRWHLMFVEDTNGNRLKLEYGNGARNTKKLLSVTDSSGRSILFDYKITEKGDLISRITGPEGLNVSFEYDEESRLLSATRGERVETYAYTGTVDTPPAENIDRFNLVSVTDPDGNTTYYDYNGAGGVSPLGLTPWYELVTAVHEPEGVDTKFSYDFPAKTRAVTDGRGFDTTYSLNDYGSVLRIDAPLGNVTEYTWLPDDILMESMTDPNGHVHTYTYDKYGNQRTERIDGIIERTVIHYPPAFFDRPISNRVETDTDRYGNITTYVYDEKGNLTNETDPEKYSTNHSYLFNGDRSVSVDGNGHATKFAYDQFGNLRRTVDPVNRVTLRSYDRRSRLITETSPRGVESRFEYDDLDRPIKTIRGANTVQAAVTEREFDPAGNKLSETDPKGRTTVFTYDRLNRLLSTSNSDGGVKELAYDENGNVVLETDWLGTATTMVYDELNRLIERREPVDGQTTRVRSFTHDGNGNKVSETDSRGYEYRFTYDRLNRLTREEGPLGRKKDHVYDSMADTTTVIDANGHVTVTAKDGLGRVVAVTDEAGAQTVTSYDGVGNVLSVRDRNGNSKWFRYDEADRLISTSGGKEGPRSYVFQPVGHELQVSVTDGQLHTSIETYDSLDRLVSRKDPEGFVWRSEYDRVGNKTAEFDPLERKTSLTYDPMNRPTGVTDPEGTLWAKTYDVNGKVLTETDGNANSTTNSYDLAGRLIASEDPLHHVTEFGYDLNDNRVSVTDPKHQVTTSVFDELNRVHEVHDPAALGTWVSYEYDPVGNKVLEVDRRGNPTVFKYDALDRLVKTTYANGDVREYGHDGEGNLVWEKDPRGIVTEYEYDEVYRPTTTTRAGVLIDRKVYDKNGRLFSQWDAGGNSVEHWYDRRGFEYVRKAADGSKETFTPDAVGNRVKRQTPENRVHTYTYDARGRKLSETDHGGNTWGFSYDGEGNVLSKNLPEGNGISYIYDKLNRLKSVTDGAGTTSYDYDENGNLVTQTNANGHLVTYEYDALNRRNRMLQHGDTKQFITIYGLDGNGNLKSLTDPMGRTTAYVYDELNRLKEENYPDPADPASKELVQVTRSYDANGNEEHREEHRGDGTVRTVDKTYDDFDREIAVITSDGGTVAYAYDNNGNRTSVTDPEGTATRYTYDKRNRLQTATTPWGMTSYQYYPDGPVGNIFRPNGTTTEYSYDRAARTESITHKRGMDTFSSYNYSYDGNGNRTMQIEYQNGVAETTTYGYDGADRLTHVEYPGEIVDYGYDGVGNRLSETKTTRANGTVLSAKTLAYNALNQLTAITDNANPQNDVTLNYDDNGNLVTKTTATGTTEYVYDGQNRLIGVSAGGNTVATYAYDAEGLRIGKESLASTVTYIRDGLDVLTEYDAADTAIASYQYADGLLSLHGATEGTAWYHNDTLGSPVVLTSSTGIQEASYKYEAFGLLKEKTGLSYNNHLFTEKELDQETALYYFGARYYDPQIGRFTTQDSYLGDPNIPGSLHRYLYAYANPTVYVDLLGYSSRPAIGVMFSLGFGLDTGGKVYVSTVSLTGSVVEELNSNLDLRQDVAVRFFNGGLGRPIPLNNQENIGKFGFDVTGAVSVTAGEGNGPRTPEYLINYYTKSAIENDFETSFSWGQAWNYNSAIESTTQIGFLEAKMESFFVHYNNDVDVFPKIPLTAKPTDHGWTGGLIVGKNLSEDERIEMGFQDFTGDITNPRLFDVRDGKSPDGYYRQRPSQAALNRAEWFLRYGAEQGDVTASISSPDWLNLQHVIHDHITPASRRFWYPEKHRFSISVEPK